MPNPENSPYMTAEEWDNMETISRDELPKNKELSSQAPGSQYLNEEFIKEHETNLNSKTNKERTFTDMDLYARNSYEDVNEQGEDRIRRNDLTIWTEVIPYEEYEENPNKTPKENAEDYNNMIVKRQKEYPRIEGETPAKYRERIEQTEEDLTMWRDVIPYKENPYKTPRENAEDYDNMIVKKQKERSRIEKEIPIEYRKRIEEAYNLDLKRDIENLKSEYHLIKDEYEKKSTKIHRDLASPEEKRELDYLKNEYNKTGFDISGMLDKYEQIKKMEKAKREELYGEESVSIQENYEEVEKNQEANEEDKKITYGEIISSLSQIVGNRIANEINKLVKKLLKNRGSKVLKATNSEQLNGSA